MIDYSHYSVYCISAFVVIGNCSVKLYVVYVLCNLKIKLNLNHEARSPPPLPTPFDTKMINDNL